MKDLSIVITKSHLGNYFDVKMIGHAPNPNFPSSVTMPVRSYKEAFDVACVIECAVKLLGNRVKRYNDMTATEDGDRYCDHMAFDRLPCMIRAAA